MLFKAVLVKLVNKASSISKKKHQKLRKDTQKELYRSHDQVAVAVL
jgi:hypothetical protein